MNQVVKMRNTLLAGAIVSLLAACGGGSSSGVESGPNNSSGQGGDGAGGLSGEDQKPAVIVANAVNPDFAAEQRTFDTPACDEASVMGDRAPQVYSRMLTSQSGETISFTVFEPSNFDCAKGNPLVFEGHGFGGARQTSPTGTITRLNEAGIGVISIDQRGFGESSGTVRVMDPDFEGQDLLQILDWAEANLDWLRYRDDGSTDGREFNMVAGSYGSSYGGGYQLLIHNVDPLHRLDALVPDITWNDLRYSLNPGAVYGVKDYQPEEGQVAAKGVIKSGWALGLVGIGEAGSVQNSGLDPVIRETLLAGASSNSFPDAGLEFFRYHSPSYYCDPEVAADQPFLQGTVTPGVAQTKPLPVDILFTQGFRDTLFNFNDAFHNFVCYRNLTDENGKKADVRLLTHQSGHILPVSAEGTPLQPLTDQFAANGGNNIEFQKAGGPQACGELTKNNAEFVFLTEKLLTEDELAVVVANQSEVGQAAYDVMDGNKGKVCLSYDDTTAEGVWVDEEQFLADLVPAAKGQATSNSFEPVAIDLPVGDPANTVTTGLLGVFDYLAQPALQEIAIPAGANAVAGIPTATINIAPIQDMLANPACADIQEGASALPTGTLGLTPACDPIVYLGLGVFREGSWRLIDSQVTPVRGYGERHVELTGVAEKFAEGEQLSLLVYGYHPQFAATSSRDTLSPVVNVSGQLSLPWLNVPEPVAQNP